MDVEEMLGRLAADGAALRSAAVYHLDKEVPTCPGWTVRDAVEHTALVYAHKATIIEGRLSSPPQPWPPDDLVIDDLLEHFDQQLQRVLEALRSDKPQTSVWTWYEDEQTIGFWIRRMMQETVIHRADVEAAIGQRPPITDDVAIDGIDEVVERMLCNDDPEYYEGYQPGHGQRILVSAADAAWTITVGEQVASFSRAAVADADATLTGEAGDVLLAMWNRLPYSELTTTGDEAALAALRELVAVATQ
jgi:uncharacterized protein (TIGR03083 family)